MSDIEREYAYGICLVMDRAGNSKVQELWSGIHSKGARVLWFEDLPASTAKMKIDPSFTCSDGLITHQGPNRPIRVASWNYTLNAFVYDPD